MGNHQEVKLAWPRCGCLQSRYRYAGQSENVRNAKGQLYVTRNLKEFGRKMWGEKENGWNTESIRLGEGAEISDDGKETTRLTAPPTSYSNQLTCVPLRLMSNEYSFTPNVCSRTFNISSDSRQNNIQLILKNFSRSKDAPVEGR